MFRAANIIALHDNLRLMRKIARFETTNPKFHAKASALFIIFYPLFFLVAE
jgi:hypothetical protein